jgi:hypothetical protein
MQEAGSPALVHDPTRRNLSQIQKSTLRITPAAAIAVQPSRMGNAPGSPQNFMPKIVEKPKAQSGLVKMHSVFIPKVEKDGKARDGDPILYEIPQDGLQHPVVSASVAAARQQQQMQQQLNLQIAQQKSAAQSGNKGPSARLYAAIDEGEEALLTASDFQDNMNVPALRGRNGSVADDAVEDDGVEAGELDEKIGAAFGGEGYQQEGYDPRMENKDYQANNNNQRREQKKPSPSKQQQHVRQHSKEGFDDDEVDEWGDNEHRNMEEGMPVMPASPRDAQDERPSPNGKKAVAKDKGGCTVM